VGAHRLHDAGKPPLSITTFGTLRGRPAASATLAPSTLPSGPTPSWVSSPTAGPTAYVLPFPSRCAQTSAFQFLKDLGARPGPPPTFGMEWKGKQTTSGFPQKGATTMAPPHPQRHSLPLRPSPTPSTVCDALITGSLLGRHRPPTATTMWTGLGRPTDGKERPGPCRRQRPEAGLTTWVDLSRSSSKSAGNLVEDLSGTSAKGSTPEGPGDRPETSPTSATMATIPFSTSNQYQNAPARFAAGRKNARNRLPNILNSGHFSSTSSRQGR